MKAAWRWFLDTFVRPPWSVREPEPQGPPWWMLVRCTCAAAPERHDVALVSQLGSVLAEFTLPADQAHQLARRIDDRKFGVSCPEFALSPMFEVTVGAERVVSVDVRRVALVDIDREEQD